MRHARREVESGERFLEFRLDYLPEPELGAQAIRAFLEEFPEVTILATCRRHQNQGHFNGSIEEQVKILEAAIAAGARAVDLEVESTENSSVRLNGLRGKALVVISYHNYEGTPQVEQVLGRMMKIPADGYKVVTTARKPSDCYRVLALARAHPRESLVLLAMGECGFPTRVLSPAFGAVYTYAAPNTAEGTAAGQVSARLLRTLYRVEKFSRHSKIYGVIADPVRHSISPAVHNRAFQSKRIDAVYLPFLVRPAQLKDFFLLAEKLPVTGFSVTIPHKQRVMRYLDNIDPLSRRIGAVNTVWRKAGRWRGTNTDVNGVLAPLSRLMRPAKCSVLIAGNGGAARSAAFSLCDAGAKVSIVGRNPDRVRALAKLCGAEPLAREQAESRRFDVLIHATSLGMHPNVHESFFEGQIPGDVVFDMVYNPVETLLIKRAREGKKTVITGVEMFLEQAVRQFETWTGETAPRAVMERAAMDALAPGGR